MGRVVPAVSRAFDILELFLDGQQTLSAPEISRRLGLPRTTVHELVATLVARSYLAPEQDGGNRYRLGIRTFQLGSRYSGHLDLMTEGQLAARQVAAVCDETVHVAILDGTDVTYVAKVDSTHAVRMVSAVGRRLPAHCTAVGKMLLSALPEPAVDARYPADRQLPAMTPNSIVSLGQLKRQLAEVRARGLASEFCESNLDVACVAAPVFDHRGETVAAMSISVPISRWDTGKQEEYGRLVADGARQLSMQLGYWPAPGPAEATASG